MSGNEAKNKFRDLSDNTQIFSDQRAASRHQTTIRIRNVPSSSRDSRRGDINRDGRFFIPDPELQTGENVAMQLRLPGLGEWVECRGVVTGTAVRGASAGIIGCITELEKQSEEAMALWQEMST